MAHLIVFQAAGHGIFPAQDRRARRHAPFDRAVQRIRRVFGDGRKVRRDVLANFFQIRLFKSLDARGNGLVA